MIMNKDSFDLDTFLANYEPKSLQDSLKHYLNDRQLTDYSVVTKHNLHKLVPGKTYIRYATISNAGGINPGRNSIKNGGILLSGGYLSKNGYKELSDVLTWTHMMLKLVIPSEELDSTIDRVFVINLTKHYVFYKLFSSEIMDQAFRDMAIEFKKNK